MHVKESLKILTARAKNIEMLPGTWVLPSHYSIFFISNESSFFQGKSKCRCYQLFSASEKSSVFKKHQYA
jgi:hypothetical protein